MDETDFRILGHLLRTPLDTTEDVARAVGLTRNAVARRVRLLEESPVRLRFFAVPHYRLFGAHSTVALFPTSGKVDAKRLLSIDNVIAYDLNHDGLVASTYWTADGHDPKQVPSTMLDVLGTPPVAQFTDATPGPKVPHLSRLEWKVLRAIVAQPRASAAALARRAGLTAKTCARHRKSLLDAFAFLPTMSIHEDRSKGFPVFRTYIQGNPKPASVEAILGADSVVTDNVAEGHVRFAHAPSFGDILARIEALRRLPHVTDVKLILSRASDVTVDKFLRLIDAKIQDPRSRPFLGPI